MSADKYDHKAHRKAVEQAWDAYYSARNKVLVMKKEARILKQKAYDLDIDPEEDTAVYVEYECVCGRNTIPTKTMTCIFCRRIFCQICWQTKGHVTESDGYTCDRCMIFRSFPKKTAS